MSLCLSRDELRELSGYRQRTKVIEWLKQQGFRPRIAADGWPRVDRNVYERIMSGAMRRTQTEPDFESVK